jgi:predicted lipoprotein
MKRRWIKYSILLVVAGLLAYNSVYFRKLDAKETVKGTSLDPVNFAQSFWDKQFAKSIDSAIEINSFLQQLKLEPQKTIQQYSRTKGIGNTCFFLLKGEGQVESMEEDDIKLSVLPAAENRKIKLNTGIYFGNAPRDVTGLISMNDFNNSMDFNKVSTELNKIVRTKVQLPLKDGLIKGSTVQFVACLEIDKEKIVTENIELLPVKAVIIKK